MQARKLMLGIGIAALTLFLSSISACKPTPKERSSPANASKVEPEANHEEKPVIVALGDSLTAGLGVPAEESYPHRLQEKLDRAGYNYRVVNAGVSGDTTAGGVRRVDWVLKSQPKIVILELGGNDGLRGIPLEETRKNLEAIIQQLQSKDIRVVLAGMHMPSNYGESYRTGFENIYINLAQKYRLSLIPFFLEGVAGEPFLNQVDGIHPTGAGYQVIVEEIWKTLEPVLKKERERKRVGSP